MPMKPNEENKDVDVNEAVIAFEVDRDVIDKVRTGEITHISWEISEDNQNILLETINVNLVLTMDEMPATSHGCHIYNGGEFPYVIKESLDYLGLDGGDEHCLTKIIDVDVEPLDADPDAGSCVWVVSFEVVPIPEEPRHYLMRWNPSISSFTEQDYDDCLKNRVHGMFRMCWSITEWEEARRGDFFFMMRSGDDQHAGIVFAGQFISDPYPSDDWAGSTKRRMYVDMICICLEETGATPHITLEKLQQTIPAFDWTKGHSGVLLSEEVVVKLQELM